MSMMNDEKNMNGDLMGRSESVKIGPESNPAYAGVPQSDGVVIEDEVGILDFQPDANAVLGAYLTSVFENAKTMRASNGTDAQLMQCLRNFKGEYSPEEATKIRSSGMPPVFFPLSEHKVHTAIAWIDEFFTNAEKLISLYPTPKPETQQDVTKLTFETVKEQIDSIIQETQQIVPPEACKAHAEFIRPIIEKQMFRDAQKKAMRMEQVLKDDMLQGKWGEKIHELITYVCIYGCAAFRSPILKSRNVYAWIDGKVGKENRITREFETISPFDLFPSAGMTDTQIGDLCVRVRYTPMELLAQKRVPLWISDVIDEIVSTYGESGSRQEISADEELKVLTEQRNMSYAQDGIIEGFEFWGQVSGKDLFALGIKRTPEKKHIVDSTAVWYEVNAIVIAGKVIYCRVMEEAEDRPLDVVKFYDTPGQFFGRGPLHIINSLQKICNASGRALIANMGFACGPQVVIDPNALVSQDDYTLRPCKIWMATQNSMSPGNTPVRVFDIQSHANELQGVFEFYQRLADEVTGIPAYANGTDATVGAARTATGLNMLFGAANRGIKKVIGNFDELVKKAVRRLYWWHMVYNTDESIKGDANIDVCGLRSFASKTSQANEMLNLMRTIAQDPRLAGLQDEKMLARLIRKAAVAFDVEPDDVAPNEEELERKIEEQKAQEEEQQRQMQEMQMEQEAQQQQGGGRQGMIPVMPMGGQPQ